MKTAIVVLWLISLLCIAIILKESGGGTFLIVLGLYLLPTIIAAFRHHLNSLAIFMCNLLLGWTFIGWILALVWSCTNNCEHKKAPA